MAITGNWKRGFADFNKQIDRDLEACTKAMGVRVLTNIVARTPVDTGNLRDNWRVGINGQESDKLPGGSGSSIVSAGSAKILGALNPFEITIENLARYANIIENGSVEQSPHSMVKLAVEMETSGVGRKLTIIQ